VPSPTWIATPPYVQFAPPGSVVTAALRPSAPLVPETPSQRTPVS
jgi:hypothetical protein